MNMIWIYMSVNFARQDKVYHIDSDYQAILFKST